MSRGVKVKLIGGAHRTPMQAALLSRSLSTTQYMSDNEARLLAVEDTLVELCAKGAIECVDWLIKNGVDPNIPGRM